jgi:hypothetical protein
MDDLLFRILAVAATAGFLPGVLHEWRTPRHEDSVPGTRGASSTPPVETQQDVRTSTSSMAVGRR